MNPVEVRCKGCQKKFMVAIVFVGAIKCDRCKKIFEYNVSTSLHMSSSVDPEVTRAIMYAESKRPGA